MYDGTVAPRFTGAILGLAALLVFSGCTLFELSRVRVYEAQQARYAKIGGTVRSETAEGAWLVVYVMVVPCDEDWDRLVSYAERGELGPDPERWSPEARELVARMREGVRIARHVTLQRAGYWSTTLAPGCYGVGAFEDLDRDLRFDDEPVAAAIADPGRLFRLREGDEHEIELVIPAEGRFDLEFDPAALQVRALELRSPKDQLLVSIGEVSHVGEVVDLSEARFGAEMGRTGYFDIWEFLWRAGVGVYLLEPYDPDRIPVLFVHGALGYPQEFTQLIASLDRKRYQPWFAHYPSGARLPKVAEAMSEMIASLDLQYDFDSMAVVAHSMGGLVSRAFVLDLAERVDDLPVRALVTIATPWGGIESAAAGVESSPYVVPSWRDVVAGGAFVESLFFDGPDRATPRNLPEGVAFHLLFPVDDETVALSSAARWEASREAVDRWPLTGGHAGVLRTEHAAILVNEILDATAW